jgi:hypothetical protein
MPNIAHVVYTDNFAQWVAKTNEMIDKVNTLSAAATVLSVSSVQAGQVLIYDGSAFRNVTMTGDVTINSNGQTTVVSGGAGTKKGRLYFAGTFRTIF